MAYLEINGAQIYYEFYSQGETVCLLHHGFGASKMWQEIYPAIIEAGFQVLMYDRRGYGMSEEGPDFVSYYRSQEFRKTCIDELEKLRQHLDLGSLHLVGQCEGGVVASDYAATYTQYVKTLVTSSTQCYSPMTMKELNALKFPKLFSELDIELQKKLIKFHGPDRAEFRYDLHRSFGGSYGAGYFDLSSVLRSIPQPALVIFPDRSFIFDVEQGVAFYRCLEKGQLAVLPGCGHNTYENQPQEYLKSLFNFWEKYEKTKPG